MFTQLCIAVKVAIFAINWYMRHQVLVRVYVRMLDAYGRRLGRVELVIVTTYTHATYVQSCAFKLFISEMMVHNFVLLVWFVVVYSSFY